MEKFGDPVLWISVVSGIVKNRALNKTKIQMYLQKCWKFSLLPKFWGPSKSGAFGLSLISLMVNPRLDIGNYLVH